MPVFRISRPELQRANDLQPLEWGLSYDLGTTMEKCLYNTPQGQQYIGLPGARMPVVGRKRQGGGGGATRKRGRPPELDWLFVNGGLPKVNIHDCIGVDIEDIRHNFVSSRGLISLFDLCRS
jgi:hypothetical protein